MNRKPFLNLVCKISLWIPVILLIGCEKNEESMGSSLSLSDSNLFNTQCYNLIESDFDGCVVLIEPGVIRLLFKQPSNLKASLQIPAQAIQGLSRGKRNKLRTTRNVGFSPIALHFEETEFAIEYAETLIEYTDRYDEFALEYTDSEGKIQVTAFVVKREGSQNERVSQALTQVTGLVMQTMD